jgi:hypothetical protein
MIIPVAHLRILLEDAVVVARLAPQDSIPKYLWDKEFVSRLTKILKKTDAEIALILANPTEDLSWFEPFAEHFIDPVKFAFLQEVLYNAY